MTLKLSDKSDLARHASPEDILKECMEFAKERDITKCLIFMVGPDAGGGPDATKKMCTGFGTKDEVTGFLQRVIHNELHDWEEY